MEAYESGLCVWNETTSSFEQQRVLWTKSAASPKMSPFPINHPAFLKDADGKEWVYFGNPLPNMRCPATFEAWQDASTWEILKPQRSLKSAADGKEIKLHSGSIAWNSFRRRWVTVFMEAGGKPSDFGELWLYSEAAAALLKEEPILRSRRHGALPCQPFWGDPLRGYPGPRLATEQCLCIDHR